MNKNIENFLNEYMINPDPQYAVFLKGNWGCGKTFGLYEDLKFLKPLLFDFNRVLRTLSVGVGAANPIARSARQSVQARKRRGGGGK